MNVFVTDGNQRPALAIARALGRRGVSVTVGEHRPGSLAARSRFCAREVIYPCPLTDRRAFDEFLLQFAASERMDAIVPVTDITTHAVCRHQAALAPYTALAVPPFDAFESVSDKSWLMTYAARLGVPTPRTHVVDDARTVDAIASSIAYPVVVKPVRSRFASASGWTPTIVQYASSGAELRQVYADTAYLATHPSLIQERIEGPGRAVFALFDRGRLVVDFAHRRLREKPPSGGASVLSESVPVDRQLREYTERVLGPLGWHGVAMMEFKQDRRTGDCYLMEVNGRFWGSLQLAIDAGVDFAWLACQLALGHSVEPSAYRVGMKSRWLLGDIDHLLLRLFKSADELQLPATAPSKWRTLVDFMKLAQRGVRYEVISGSDPGPFCEELRQYARGLAAAGTRLVKRRARPARSARRPGTAVAPTT